MSAFNLLPFQVGYILGIPYMKILALIDEGKLKIDRETLIFTIEMDDLIDFLGQHRECVGRLYCDCGISAYDDWKRKIIEEMDKRWPLEVTK